MRPTGSTSQLWVVTCQQYGTSAYVHQTPFRGQTGGSSAKKVVSDSPGLADFAIGLVNSVFNLPDGQVMFFEEFE